MIIQVMSKKEGHQQLEVLEKKDLQKTLDGIPELKKGYQLHAKMKGTGEQVLMTPKQLEKAFVDVDTVLVRQPITAG